MHPLLRPTGPASPRLVRGIVVLLLVVSAVLIVAAAAAMPPAFSWITHAVSESAAQSQSSAWIARMSFLFFGGAVLILSINRRPIWSRAAYWSHLVFASCMLGTAAFSHKPWTPGIAFDATEDLLHSVTATAMGFAFVAGVLARLLERRTPALSVRLLDGVAVLAGTALSPLGTFVPDVGGLLQRAMFLVAYLWYGAEAMRAAKTQE